MTQSLLLILALLVSCPALGEAATYYVDVVTGRDANNGKSATTPWKTIAKVNAARIAPGDAVLFRCGQEWREALVIPSGGTAKAGVTFGAYGSGSKPCINGSDLVQGWVRASSLWKARLSTAPAVVYFNGQRGRRQRALAQLAKEQDWHWEANTLYVYSPGDPAAIYTQPGIEAATRPHCVAVPWNAGRNYVRLRDLELKNSALKGLYLPQGNHHWIVEGLTVHHNGVIDGNDAHGLDIHGDHHLIIRNRLYEIGANGIQVSSRNTVVESNEVSNPHHHGIDIKSQGPGEVCEGNIVRYNKVYCTPDHTSPANGIYVGTLAGPASDTKVYYNAVFNLEVRGIQVQGNASGTEIYNNTVCNSGEYDYYLDTSGTANLQNNLSHNAGGRKKCLRLVYPANKTLDFNCWYVPAGAFAAYGLKATLAEFSNWGRYREKVYPQETNSINANPLLSNLAVHDVRLQPGSPAIDAGTKVGLARDFYGNAVPQSAAPDMGAAEYVK